MALEWGKSTNEIILPFEIQPELRLNLASFVTKDFLVGLLGPILEDEVVLAQVLVVELADDLDWSRLLVEHVLLSIFATSVFNLVCEVPNVGDKSTNEIVLPFEIQTTKGRTGMIYKD